MADGNRIDVPRLAALAGVTTPKPVPNFEPTAAQREQLTRLVRQVVAAWNTALREEILPAYRRQFERREAARGLSLGVTRGGIDELEAALTRAAQNTAAKAAALEPQVAAYVAELAAWHTARFAAGIRHAARVDIRPLLSPSDADDLLRGAVRRNVALIKGLDAEMAKKVETAVFNAWNQNDSAKKLVRVLKTDLGFAPARAKLIANDQVGKLAGELDKFRHAEAGIDKFVWVRTVSAQPRPEHLELAGKVFAWSSPPQGVIPGQLINCKCRAMAYVEPKAA